MRCHRGILSVIQRVRTPTGEDAVRSPGSDPCDGVPVSGDDSRNPWRSSVGASIDDGFEEEWTSLPTDRGFALHRVLVWLGALRERRTGALFAEILAKRAVSAFTADDVTDRRARAGRPLVYDGARDKLFCHWFERFLLGEQKNLQELERVEA